MIAQKPPDPIRNKVFIHFKEIEKWNWESDTPQKYSNRKMLCLLHYFTAQAYLQPFTPTRLPQRSSRVVIHFSVTLIVFLILMQRGRVLASYPRNGFAILLRMGKFYYKCAPLQSLVYHIRVSHVASQLWASHCSSVYHIPFFYFNFTLYNPSMGHYVCRKNIFRWLIEHVVVSCSALLIGTLSHLS